MTIRSATSYNKHHDVGSKVCLQEYIDDLGVNVNASVLVLYLLKDAFGGFWWDFAQADSLVGRLVWPQEAPSCKS